MFEFFQSSRSVFKYALRSQIPPRLCASFLGATLLGHGVQAIKNDGKLGSSLAISFAALAGHEVLTTFIRNKPFDHGDMLTYIIALSLVFASNKGYERYISKKIALENTNYSINDKPSLKELG